MSNGVVVDVTSLISAEEYLTSQNQRTRPRDPFARQCFVELVQTLIFIDDVYVVHPLLAAPAATDFGSRPHLLQALVQRGMLRPLRLTETQWSAVQDAEGEAAADLKSPIGSRSVVQFVEQALICDRTPGSPMSLSDRLRRWTDFQRGNVRVAGHHQARIDTSDGVELDEFGSWARAAAIVLEGSLSLMAPDGEGHYLMASLARGIKYHLRATAGGLCYQPHPMRRDFAVTFDLNRGGAAADVVFDVIRAIRGIHESLAQAVGPLEPQRIRVLELELPLLGGRLWQPSEVGKVSDEQWLELVVARIAEYRERAADLREAIASCVTDEDYLVLARDIEGVRNRLLEALGLRTNEPSQVEQELVDSVASVARATTGVSVVRGLYFGTRGLGRRLSHRFSGRPFQQFLYREFVRAWKLAGR